MISYIKLPHIPGRVAGSRLRKSIYGLKQASRVQRSFFKSRCNATANRELLSNPCIYFSTTAARLIIIVAYVDDIPTINPISIY